MFGPVQSTFTAIDAIRRAQGDVLRRLGLGAAEAPSRAAASGPGYVLRDFGAAGPAAADLVLIPAPIKSAALWDLLPDLSIVQRARAAGFRVWRIDWTPDPDPPEDRGLSAFAVQMIGAAVDAVAAETGRARPVIAGHSLGGTFAGLFAARRPDVPAAVVLVEGPLAFGPESGPLSEAARGAPPDVFADLGAVMPGSLLGAIAGRVLPDEFQWWRLVDRMMASATADRLRIHLAVDRWTQDEFPMPRRLFLDVFEQLYRSDRFMAGHLVLDGVGAAPADIVAPVLAIVDPGGRVVPEAAIRPALAASRSREVRILPWQPEVGAGLRHVSAMVGPDAHRRLWPDVLAWALDRATAAVAVSQSRP